MRSVARVTRVTRARFASAWGRVASSSGALGSLVVGGDAATRRRRARARVCRSFAAGLCKPDGDTLSFKFKTMCARTFSSNRISTEERSRCVVRRARATAKDRTLQFSFSHN